MSCISNNDCPLTEACIGNSCKRPCDVHNPCAKHAACINTNHGSDCSCIEGYQGNGYVGCVPGMQWCFQYLVFFLLNFYKIVIASKPICQYNEDCPPDKLCDRLNRVCINPCFEDSCGDNAQCMPENHAVKCICLPGYSGNPYTQCERGN